MMKCNSNMQVNVIVGRFQPLTVEDISVARKMKHRNGLPVVALYIRSHQGYANTPFKSRTVKTMLEDAGIFCDVLHSDDWAGIERTLQKHGYMPRLIYNSDHNSLKSQCARLAVAAEDRGEFKRFVPRSVDKQYTELVDEMHRYQSIDF